MGLLLRYLCCVPHGSRAGQDGEVLQGVMQLGAFCVFYCWGIRDRFVDYMSRGLLIALKYIMCRG